jgi:RHH-type rel operon transcriptional repressor/antitoxin RelB
MMTLELDDETATLLNQLVEQEHISPEQLVKNVLLEHLEDSQDAKKADDAYQRYLEGGKISHNLNDVVKELGLDS